MFSSARLSLCSAEASLFARLRWSLHFKCVLDGENLKGVVGFIADLESRSMCALFGAMSYFWPSFEPPFEVLLRSVRSKSRMVAVQYEVHYFWSPSSYTCGFPTFDCILVMMVWPVDGKYHI